MPDGRNGKLTTIRSVDEATGIRDLWLSLCRHRDADPDISLHVVATVPGASPYILLLETPGKTALLVGRMSTTRLNIRIGYFRLPCPRMRIVEFIAGGIMGEIGPDEAREVITHLAALLKSGEADVVSLHYTDVTSTLFSQFASAAGPLTRDRAIRPMSHRLRHWQPNGVKFFDSITRNERSNQRRREKKLLTEYAGDVRIAAYHDAASIERLMDDAEYVTRRSYQRNIGVGFKHTPAIRQLLELLAKKGWLRAWVLYLRGTPAAFWIGALRDGTFLSDYIAYDLSLAALSPGAYLTMKVLEELQDTDPGAHAIDFGPGETEWKARLGNEIRELATIYWFAPTFKSLLVNGLRTAAYTADTSAKALFRRTGMLDQLKRRLRRMSGATARDSAPGQ